MAKKSVTFEKLPPKIKEVRLSDEGLQEIVLQLGKREIVVSEEDYFSKFRLGQAVNDMMADPLPDQFVQNFTINIYPALVACSYGNLPTHHQFPHMGETSIKLWIEKARELNPDANWFEFLDSIENANEAQEIEKKE